MKSYSQVIGPEEIITSVSLEEGYLLKNVRYYPKYYETREVYEDRYKFFPFLKKKSLTKVLVESPIIEERFPDSPGEVSRYGIKHFSPGDTGVVKSYSDSFLYSHGLPRINEVMIGWKNFNLDKESGLSYLPVYVLPRIYLGITDAKSGEKSSKYYSFTSMSEVIEFLELIEDCDGLSSLYSPSEGKRFTIGNMKSTMEDYINEFYKLLETNG